jgi:hypothetical protein
LATPPLSVLPLKDLTVLSAFHGHSNRITRHSIVREIAENFDEKLLQPLIGFKEGGVIHVIDGQHRHAGLLRRGVALNVPIFIYDATYLDKGETVADFITRIRKGVHTRAAQSGIDELSTRASLSPWYTAMLAANVEVNFQNPHKLNVPNILRARIAVDEIQARIANGETPDVALLGVQFNMPTSKLLEAWVDYDKVKVKRTVAVIARWSNLVAEPAAAVGRKGYTKALVLAFPLLIEEEPDAAPNLVSDMYKRVGTTDAPKSQNPIEVLGELLYHANFKRAAQNRITLLGRNLWGSQNWKKA